MGRGRGDKKESAEKCINQVSCLFIIYNTQTYTHILMYYKHIILLLSGVVFGLGDLLHNSFKGSVEFITRVY